MRYGPMCSGWLVISSEGRGSLGKPEADFHPVAEITDTDVERLIRAIRTRAFADSLFADSPSSQARPATWTGMTPVRAFLSARSRRAALLAVAAALTAPISAQCGLVADLTPGTTNNPQINWMVSAFGEEIYFNYYSATSGSELWKWSAANGAQIVADLGPGLYGTNPEHITPACTIYGPRVFFSGFEIGHGAELYVSDGTAAGTGRAKEIQPGSGGSLPFDFAASGGKVFFNARDTTNGEELWVTDGTGVGTVRLSDFAPGVGNGRPNDMTDLNGVVVFSAYDPTTGRELFVSDGTPAGTHLLRDLEPGPVDSSPREFTRVGDLLYFTATKSPHGMEVWKTDGTPGGTVMIADMFTGNSIGPVELCACGDRLFFHEWKADGHGPVYVTDGTAAGTVNLGAVGGTITCSGNRVFFRATHYLTGYELWTSDGTIAGTHLVVDLEPGTASGNPTEIVDCGPGVCFVARVAARTELWYSDGTATGTTRLCSLDPTGNTAPNQLTMCRGRLFMQAYAPAHGAELFAVATPGASKALLGGSGAPNHPRIGTVAGAVPVLGSSVGIRCLGPAGHVGALLVGGAGLPLPIPSIPGLIQGGCDWVGLQTGAAVSLATVAASSFTLPLAIPNNATLEGVVLLLQNVWFHPTASPSLQVSNGLQLVLGAGAPH